MKRKFEDLLIEHCSPTLAGVKTANLFCYCESNDENICKIAEVWNRNLEKYGIGLAVIKKCFVSNHYLIYVYRKKALAKDLENVGVKTFLAQNGYESCQEIDDYLLVLSGKLSESDSFPHEIGLFLGYPLNDVIGFIKNKGKNYYFCGFWKVYENPQEAQRCFEQFRKCTEIYKEMYQRGRSIIQLAVAA